MFSEQERNIFEYFDGEKKLFGDPLALQRKIRIALGADWDFVREHTGPGDHEEPQKSIAHGKMLAAVREAFGMRPFDPLSGKGATDKLCLATWNTFSSWLDEKKNPPVTSPTTPPFSAGLVPPSMAVR